MLKLNPTILLCLAITATAHADPCGMVPPIYTGNQIPITRIGEQNTYVSYKDGIETFVIRPGFRGNVEEFGMLIPFPTPPALRKVPDAIFNQLANAVDPPEIVVYAYPEPTNAIAFNGAVQQSAQMQLTQDSGRVVVLRQEAVGMYEVAVLEAGSAAALKKWMDAHGFKYPEGMDKPCNEYVEAGWCFVAVKTKVGAKDDANAQPGQRNVKVNLPQGSSFDGYVQGMGFRFKSKNLVVPMRLSAFNKGELRNIVYLLTDGPKRIRSIPEEYVMRQLDGKKLLANVTQPLPVRIIPAGAQIPKWRKDSLPQERNPVPHNGQAKELFASDLLAITSGELSLPFEEEEKELLRIGERFGLRGGDIDALHADALKKQRDDIVAKSIKSLDSMTLSVIDGDFPREVLADKNLTFAEYTMSNRRNRPEIYDTKMKGPAGRKEGALIIGKIDAEDNKQPWTVPVVGLIACMSLALLTYFGKRNKT